MEDLTFGEQVKVVLSRKRHDHKGTCGDYRRKDRNENVQTESDAETGKRQFQEQDMRMIASILDCPFQLSILGGESAETDACGSAYRRRDAQKRRKIRGWRADT